MRQGCRQLYRSFWHSNFITCERVAAGPTKVAKKKAVFDTRTSFLAKGLPPTLQNCKKVLVFEARTTFRAKGLLPDQPKSQFYRSFWHSNLVSCERGRQHFKIAILLQFLTLEPRFVPKGCRRTKKSRTKKKKAFCATRTAKGWPLRFAWLALPADLRETRKRRRGTVTEGKRQREREGEREGEREREDVKMRRCEDMKIRRCEDEKIWRSEDKKIRRCDEDVNTWRCRRTLRWDALGKNHTEIGFICTNLANNGAPPCNYKQYQPVIN